MPNTYARALRKNLTDAEQRLWGQLRLRRLHGVKFRRQQPFGAYIVDFVCFERKLIVEVDGGQHVERRAYDEARTQWLEAQGYRVVRFWDNDVLTDTDAVLEAILRAVAEDSPPP